MPMSIRFSPEEEARLETLANSTGRPTSFYVRQAVHTYLVEIEEAYWQDEAVRDWEKSGKPSRPAEELWVELGGLRRQSRWGTVPASIDGQVRRTPPAHRDTPAGCR